MMKSFKYLMQVIKILTEKSYNDKEFIKIYEFLITIDFNELKQYYNSNNIPTYSNDLDVYHDTVLILIKILEEMEKYEECHELMKKINQCKIITLKNQIDNE